MNVMFANLVNNFSTYQGDGLLLHIRQHLSNLFNNRQYNDESAIMGIPDLNELLNNLPAAENELGSAVRMIIEKYEPRLSKLHVKQQEQSNEGVAIQLLVEATLYNHAKVNFTVQFTHDGNVILE